MPNEFDKSQSSKAEVVDMSDHRSKRLNEKECSAMIEIASQYVKASQGSRIYQEKIKLYTLPFEMVEVKFCDEFSTETISEAPFGEWVENHLKPMLILLGKQPQKRTVIYCMESVNVYLDAPNPLAEVKDFRRLMVNGYQRISMPDLINQLIIELGLDKSLFALHEDWIAGQCTEEPYGLCFLAAPDIDDRKSFPLVAPEDDVDKIASIIWYHFESGSGNNHNTSLFLPCNCEPGIIDRLIAYMTEHATSRFW